MTCVPGCLCFNDPDMGMCFQPVDRGGACPCGHGRHQHKPLDRFCAGEYACTCSVKRWEAWFFFEEDDLCLDPTCGHLRSRHPDHDSRRPGSQEADSQEGRSRWSPADVPNRAGLQPSERRNETQTNETRTQKQNMDRDDGKADEESCDVDKEGQL